MDKRGAESAAQRPLRAALTLAAAVGIAVAVLAMVHEATRERVAASERAHRGASLDRLLGELRHDNDLLADRILVSDSELLGSIAPLPVYRARLGGEPVAAILETVAPEGYSGSIRLLVAVTPDGRLLGVRVLEHHETPGLGDAIEERRSGWILSFTGRSLGDPPPQRWRVRKDGGDFDQFTGATVTPRAVVTAVRNVLAYVEKRGASLYEPADASPGTAAGGH
jgi:electron transport complex protein RnfG